MKRRAVWFGLLAGLVSGCVAVPPPPATLPTAGAPAPAQPVPESAGPRHVALLLPLTGPSAALGQALRQAALLAFSAPGAPAADIHDTGGDPARAGSEAAAAIAAGDALILGPLTAAETEPVARVAQPAGIPVLSFSSDPAAAQPGVWTLGITPGQQMRRLVSALRDDGRQHLAALLPPGPLGDALGAAYTEAASEAGLASPDIRRTEGGSASLADGLRAVAGSGHADQEEKIRALHDAGDPASLAQAAALAAAAGATPNFDALLLCDTGETLRGVADQLPGLGIVPPLVRVVGPALWARDAGRLGALAGAWFAATDPAARAPFAAAYEARYDGQVPPPLADLAFDAAAIARVTASEGDMSVGSLTRAQGFSGVDGVLALMPDGRVHRSLAVFEIEKGGGARIVRPAPADLSAPGV